METGDVLGGSVADASVRLATALDAESIGATQARAWRAAYADVLPAATLDSLRGPDLAGPWREAIVRPPTARHAVFVACSGATVVGFAAVGPASDPDQSGESGQVGELTALVVDPAHQRHGHGSRLLSATVARLRDLDCTGVVAWVPQADRPRQVFLGSAGMVADGARRDFALDDGGRLTEIRLTAALAS